MAKLIRGVKTLFAVFGGRQRICVSGKKIPGALTLGRKDTTEFSGVTNTRRSSLFILYFPWCNTINSQLSDIIETEKVMADNQGWRMIERGSESKTTELWKSVLMILMADNRTRR